MAYIDLITGLIMAGEALMLIVSRHWLREEDDPWRSDKNDLFLAFDLLAGLGLITTSFDPGNDTRFLTAVVLLIIALFTFSYREAEYLKGWENPFCGNALLFAVNNIILLGVVLALVMKI